MVAELAVLFLCLIFWDTCRPRPKYFFYFIKKGDRVVFNDLIRFWVSSSRGTENDRYLKSRLSGKIAITGTRLKFPLKSPKERRFRATSEDSDAPH